MIGSEEERSLLKDAIPELSNEEYEPLVAIAQDKILKGNTDNPELDKVVRSLLKHIYLKINYKLHSAYRSTVQHESIYVSQIFSRCIEALIDAIVRYKTHYIEEETGGLIRANFKGWAKKYIRFRIKDEIRKLERIKGDVPIEEIGVAVEESETEPGEERFMPKGTLEELRAKNIKFGWYDAILRSKDFSDEEKQLLEWRVGEGLTLHAISLQVYRNIKYRVLIKKKWDKLKVKIRRYIEKHSGQKYPLIS